MKKMIFLKVKNSYNKKLVTWLDLNLQVALNNTILILSGLYLFYRYHLDNSSLVLYLKVTLGLILALAFFVIPKFLEIINAKPKFRVIFHYLYFILLILVITFSQYI